jgi:shikimate dehydrogenase
MKFGIIGNPVSHSQSPKLFAQLCPGKGTYDKIEEPDFEKAYGIFLRDYDAVNVTMPFKELAYYKCKPGSEAVRTMKAVNILKKEGDKVVGYNSDYLGVKAILEQEGVAGERLLVVGCGGAAKAAAVAAADAGCKVSMTNRSYEKCYSFVRHSNLDVEVLELKDVSLESFNYIIYAIPAPIDELSGWNFAEKTVMEANYANPCLRERVAADGGNYIEGIVWLRAQAVAGFQIMLLSL